MLNIFKLCKLIRQKHNKTTIISKRINSDVICATTNKAEQLCKNIECFSALRQSFYSFVMPNRLQTKKRNHAAFSLIEMLMALLVASLLLAALAPVMTRRMADSEIKVMSEAANYDKDSIITIFNYDDSSETQEFNIPTDTNRITVTMMGGGGKGGDALYGNKTIYTTETNWTVPNGVNKLRVFMIGAGGGGASGGTGSGIAYGTLTGATSSATITATGVSSWTIPSNVKGNVPELDFKCKNTPVNPPSKWNIVQDNNNKAGASEPFLATVAAPGETLVKVEACGGGGGGRGLYSGSDGGSGGHVNRYVAIPSNLNSVSVTIGGGGGGGGSENLNGSGLNGVGWGGGGGGSETYTYFSAWKTSLYIAQGISPGGNGGSVTCDCYSPKLVEAGKNGAGVFSKTIKGNNGNDITLQAGNGGGSNFCGEDGTGGSSKGGDGSLEGGGGGGGGGTGSQGGGGGGATFFGRYANSTTNDKNFFLVAAGGGGGGGGNGGGGGGAGGGSEGGSSGLGGNSGSVGGTSPVGNSNYCAGGISAGGTASRGTSGKNGYMKISWGGSNQISCNYNLPSNGGGGGGAGQIWIGEIDVTPGQKVNFNIGNGGGVQTLPASDGNDGGATSIAVGGNTYSVSGGKGGRYESDDAYIANSGGLGGGIRTSNFNSSARYNNWTNKNYTNGGTAGGQGYLESDTQNSAGGNGGTSYKLDGTVVLGGISGSNNTDGSNAITANYGTGGGGGGGGNNGSFGTGGKGANGYIYIEWGGTNGSGGTMGEFIQKTIANIDGNDRKMIINIGKGGEDSSNNGNGYDTSISVKSGGKNITLNARGGLRGNDGTSEVDVHGDSVLYPDSYSDLYKEYVQGNMSIINGQNGSNDYGGMGGYISCLYYTNDEEGNKVCNQSVKSNDGLDTAVGVIRPGCGGSSITSPLYDSICIPYSTSANPNGGNGVFGAGGGGGSVLEKTKGIGGKGGNGFVILEYKSVQ